MGKPMSWLFGGGGGSGPTNAGGGASEVGSGAGVQPTLANGGATVADLLPDYSPQTEPAGQMVEEAPKDPLGPPPALPTPEVIAEKQSEAIIQQGKKRGRASTNLTNGMFGMGTSSLSLTSSASKQLLGV